MKTLRHTPPYSQQYRFLVDSAHGLGETIIDYYTHRFAFKPREFWAEMIVTGNITVNHAIMGLDYVLKENDVVRTVRHDVQEPDVDADYKILYDEYGVLIVDKPAPLPVHPAGRYFKNSLVHILREKYPEKIFHTIHRLDTWTTGVLVLATESEKARFLHRQVEEKKMKKIYGVMAVGNFGDKEFVIDEPVGRIAGVQRGFGEGVHEAKASITRFTPVAKKNELTLLRAEPITGRTNQIRLHIKAAGGTILNDTLYSPHPTEDVPFMGLHCRSMSFAIEENGPEETFTAPWPGHFCERFSVDELEKVVGRRR